MKQMIPPPSTVAYSQRHKDIVSSKTNTIKGCVNATKNNLLRIEPQVVSRYIDFEQAITQKTLFNFSEQTSFSIYTEDLLSCYKNKTKKVKEIFKLIKDTQPKRFLSLCPYCGLTIPKTHDHYLPESRFPELAVHALNLVPCCGACNETKNKYWRNDNHRIFLHFYSDIIPQTQYIKATLYSIDTSAVGASFAMQRPDNVADYIWEILEAHYEQLKLIEQYNENVNDEISCVHNSCVAHLRNGGTSLSGFINDLLIPEEHLFGTNHWRVVLMKKLANSNVFSICVNNSV